MLIWILTQLTSTLHQPLSQLSAILSKHKVAVYIMHLRVGISKSCNACAWLQSPHTSYIHVQMSCICSRRCTSVWKVLANINYTDLNFDWQIEGDHRMRKISAVCVCVCVCEGERYQLQVISDFPHQLTLTH